MNNRYTYRIIVSIMINMLYMPLVASLNILAKDNYQKETDKGPTIENSNEPDTYSSMSSDLIKIFYKMFYMFIFDTAKYYIYDIMLGSIWCGIRWMFTIALLIVIGAIIIKILWIFIQYTFGRPNTPQETYQGFPFSFINNFGPMQLQQGTAHIRNKGNPQQEIQLTINNLSKRKQKKGEDIHQYGEDIIKHT